MTCSKSYSNIYGSPSLMFLSHRASCHWATPGASAKAYSPSRREGSSRKANTLSLYSILHEYSAACVTSRNTGQVPKVPNAVAWRTKHDIHGCQEATV